MPLFEGYERRINKINETLKAYGMEKVEDAVEICKEKKNEDVTGIPRFRCFWGLLQPMLRSFFDLFFYGIIGFDVI